MMNSLISKLLVLTGGRTTLMGASLVDGMTSLEVRMTEMEF